MMPPSSWYRLEELAQRESTMRRAIARHRDQARPVVVVAGGVARSADHPRGRCAARSIALVGPIGRR